MKLNAHVERVIAQPSDLIYHLLADFVNHHPRFLPPQFSSLIVLAGGYGAGTEYRVSYSVGGTTREYQMTVSEPEPGRVLMEHDPQARLETTFTVMPEGTKTRVVIQTTWQSSSGLSGLLEALFGPALTRQVYEDELDRLEAYAPSQRGAVRVVVAQHS